MSSATPLQEAACAVRFRFGGIFALKRRDRLVYGVYLAVWEAAAQPPRVGAGPRNGLRGTCGGNICRVPVAVFAAYGIGDVPCGVAEVVSPVRGGESEREFAHEGGELPARALYYDETSFAVAFQSELRLVP